MQHMIMPTEKTKYLNPWDFKICVPIFPLLMFSWDSKGGGGLRPPVDMAHGAVYMAQPVGRYGPGITIVGSAEYSKVQCTL